VLAALAVFMAPLPCAAQSGPGPEAAVAAQEWSLPQLMAGLASVRSSDKRFVEKKYSSLLAAPIEVRGTLKYVAPARLEKHASAPVEEALVVDRERLTLENKSKGVKRSLSLPEYPVVWAFVEGIRSTLAGDLDTLKRFYKVRLEGGQRQWSLRLEPIEPQMAELVQSIVIGGESDRILTIEITEASGDRSVMTIS
jgi:hypothetical protein